ncbi:hypothetical protein SteCoe_37691 [Stentor coeruleus]|uniref:Uncharacterized protein n=1 Tax=Stentor coeruleus TaxID=5963 RepID=A0A1R2AMH4_9CILI|nr:hypothetical protein SteCoe_37691 [Stentor coeruleus]
MQCFKNEIISLFKDKQFLEEAANYSNEQLTKFILAKRYDSIRDAGNKLSSTLSKNNRCPKCTLPLPCKHYIKEKTNSFTVLSNEGNNAFNIQDEGRSSFKTLFEQYIDPKKEKKRLKLLEELHKYKEKKFNLEKTKIEENANRKLKVKEFKELKGKANNGSLSNSVRSTSRNIKIKRIKRLPSPDKFKEKMDEIDSILETQKVEY